MTDHTKKKMVAGLMSKYHRKERPIELKQYLDVWFEKFLEVRRKKRTIAYKKQKGRCVYCNKLCWLPESRLKRNNAMATLEHIVPQSEGGTDSMANLLMSCEACNRLRGSIPHEDFMTLARTQEGRKEAKAMMKLRMREKDLLKNKGLELSK